jgi:GntR family transcriptional regulator
VLGGPRSDEMREGTQKGNCADLQVSPVNADSPIPLYYQVEADLRRLLTSGALPPGAALPPEMELCECYGVGRHTVRRALARLRADGLITRHAGRGTFAKEPPDRAEFFLDRSFTYQMAEMGKHAHSEILDFSDGMIGPDAPRVLQKHVGSRCFSLARLRFGDGEPIGLQYTTVIAELCPGLETRDFAEDSLYDVLSRDYGLVITEIHHTVNAVAADGYQARLLRVSDGEPLLLVKTVAFLGNHEIIEHTVSYYRTDKYEYNITQSCPAD